MTLLLTSPPDASATARGLLSAGAQSIAGVKSFVAASMVLGNGDAGASPAAFTLRGPAAAGSNIPGADLTIDAPNGTGTGGSGKIAFRTALAGSTGTAPNTFVTRWQMNGSRFEVPATTSGKGPFGMESSQATFNGTVDPIFASGYNQRADGTLIQSGENGCTWNIEGDYNDGVNRVMETYCQYTSADGLTARRPIFIQMSRTANTVLTMWVASPLSIMAGDCTTQLYKLDSSLISVYGNTPIRYLTNNVPVLQQMNAAGNGTYTIFQLNASDQIVIGATVLLSAGLLFPASETFDIGALSATRPNNLYVKTLACIGTTGTTSPTLNLGGSSTTSLIAIAVANAGAQTIDQITAIRLTGNGTAAAGNGGAAQIAAYTTSASGGSRGTGLAFYADTQTGSAGLRIVGFVSAAGNWGLGTGWSASTLPGSLLHLAEAGNIQVGTTTGTKIGTATGQKIAFHNSTPVIQRASAAQAAVVTTAATQTTPFGFATGAQADAIVTLVNELRAALVEKGLIKGAA